MTEAKDRRMPLLNEIVRLIKAREHKPSTLVNEIRLLLIEQGYTMEKLEMLYDRTSSKNSQPLDD